MVRWPQVSKRVLEMTLGYAALWVALYWARAIDLGIPFGSVSDRWWPFVISLTDMLYGIGFTLALPLLIDWYRWARERGTFQVSVVLSIGYVWLWHWLVFVATAIDWPTLRVTVAEVGLAGLFMLGLGWVIWYVEREAQRIVAARRKNHFALETVTQAETADEPSSANPLDPYAWYYGRGNRKLNQSLVVLAAYTAAFFLALFLVSQLSGCSEIYEMPAGGGQPIAAVQQVKIKKVVKKKFVINPFSAIIFKPPPIDDIKLQLNEVTQHQYVVGYGEGAGAGFAGGTNLGKVRFIRLEYAGGDWDQDFGQSSDLNILIEYNVRTGQKVAEQTESRTVAQLGNFKLYKSPPMIYMTGQRNISLTKSEINTLREYLIDKHGMIFGDNGGSPNFHRQFFAMMSQVLPNIAPVKVPLDDPIHRAPYPLPFLPYVAPHGGKDAWGWKVDGRWVCYYHPGDIGDAWADDHAGVKRDVWEACYQLGVNVIFYAHMEYSKWLQAQGR